MLRDFLISDSQTPTDEIGTAYPVLECGVVDYSLYTAL